MHFWVVASMIEWRDAFSVGNKLLDVQHQQLVEIINQISTGLSASEEATVRQARFRVLLDATEKHFETENRVLAEILAGARRTSSAARILSKTAIETHIQAHSKALTQLRLIVEKIERTCGSEVLGHTEELVAWFVDHSVKHDADLKAVFQAM